MTEKHFGTSLELVNRYGTYRIQVTREMKDTSDLMDDLVVPILQSAGYDVSDLVCLDTPSNLAESLLGPKVMKRDTTDPGANEGVSG